MIQNQVVKYGTHPLQSIKLFFFDPKNKKTLLFIHGGAWRDPNNTFDDFSELISQLPKSDTNYVGVNYRLSPEVKHPEHLVDIVDSIVFLQKEYGVDSISLVGHSVGATLILQLLTYKSILGSSRAIDSIKMTIRDVFFVDGIYDIVDLIDEYGADYKSFVDEAHESTESYTNATALRGTLEKSDFDLDFQNAFLIQSLDDELLSTRQTDLMAAFLKKRGAPYTDLRGHWGKHEEVYRRSEIAEIIKSSL